MSRTKKNGLDYFPLDTDFFKDDRIRRVAVRFGADGPLLYIYILCRVYRDGYAVELNEDFLEDAALELHCGIDKVAEIIRYMTDRSLLSQIQTESRTFLTSHGIQKQYQQSMSGRKREVFVDSDLWILSDFETEKFLQKVTKYDKSEKYDYKSEIYDDNSPDSPGNGTQSKIKSKTKIKEDKREKENIKEKEKEAEKNISSCAALEKSNAPTVITLPLNDGTDYAVTEEQCLKWEGLYPAVDVKQQLRSMYGWLDAHPRNRKTRTGIKRFVTGWLAKEQDKAPTVKTAPTLQPREPYAKDSFPYMLASWMDGRIAERSEAYKQRTEDQIQLWSDAFQRFQAESGIDWDDIKYVLAFSQKHRFWSARILSPEKFVENYTQLELDYRQESERGN